MANEINDTTQRVAEAALKHAELEDLKLMDDKEKTTLLRLLRHEQTAQKTVKWGVRVRNLFLALTKEEEERTEKKDYVPLKDQKRRW